MNKKAKRIEDDYGVFIILEESDVDEFIEPAKENVQHTLNI